MKLSKCTPQEKRSCRNASLSKPGPILLGDGGRSWRHKTSTASLLGPIQGLEQVQRGQAAYSGQQQQLQHQQLKSMRSREAGSPGMTTIAPDINFAAWNNMLTQRCDMCAVPNSQLNACCNA
jgi:hypothetical protein